MRTKVPSSNREEGLQVGVPVGHREAGGPGWSEAVVTWAGPVCGRLLQGASIGWEVLPTLKFRVLGGIDFAAVTLRYPAHFCFP